MKAKNLLMMTLFLFLSIGLMAQEKYEQGIVLQNGVLVVFLEGKPMEVTKLKAAEVNDYGVILKKVAELREQGWEVFNTVSVASGYSYFIRRKIK